MGDVKKQSGSQDEVETTIVTLIETTAPAAIAGKGRLWIKNDTPNTPWFTDDAGNAIFLGQSDYAGIYVEGNSTSMTIDIQHGWNQIEDFDSDMPENISNGGNGSDNITIGAGGDYRVTFHASAIAGGTNKTYAITAFKMASSGSAITSTNEANPISVAATAHGFSTGNKVRITGITTADELNNRIFTITKSTNDAFTLQEDNGGNVNGSGFGNGTGGTATRATELKGVHADRKFAAQDVGQASGGGFVTLAKDDVIEMYVKNITDAVDITFETVQFMVQRVG